MDGSGVVETPPAGSPAPAPSPQPPPYVPAPPAPLPPEKKRGLKGVLIALVVIVGFFMLAMATCVPLALLSDPGPRPGVLSGPGPRIGQRQVSRAFGTFVRWPPVAAGA